MYFKDYFSLSNLLLLIGVGGGSHNFSTMCFGPCYHADGGLTSLSTSKDGSQVVVAGRNGETMSRTIL